MVTKEQAMTENEFHYGDCRKVVGPRGGVRFDIRTVRRNGATKVWKTRPNEFRMPYKYGMWEHGYIDQYNASDFHVASDCTI